MGKRPRAEPLLFAYAACDGERKSRAAYWGAATRSTARFETFLLKDDTAREYLKRDHVHAAHHLHYDQGPST